MPTEPEASYYRYTCECWSGIATLPLNKINMNIQADVVHLNATLNYRGLALLEKKIASLKALMDPDDSEEDAADDGDAKIAS